MQRFGLLKAPDPRIEKLTPDALRSLADAIDAHDREAAGDGSAVFLSDMTDDEHEDYVHRTEDGWQPVLDKVANLSAKTDGGNV